MQPNAHRTVGVDTDSSLTPPLPIPRIKPYPHLIHRSSDVVQYSTSGEMAHDQRRPTAGRHGGSTVHGLRQLLRPL